MRLGMIGSNLKTSAGAKQRITTIRGTEDLHELCVCVLIYMISHLFCMVCVSVLMQMISHLFCFEKKCLFVKSCVNILSYTLIN